MDDPQDAKGWPTRSGVLTNETKETQLAQLIGEVFTPEDLRRFVRYGPKGDEIARRLPFASNMLTLAVEFVDEYRRYGLIDSAFFDRIADFRPSEAARIRTVEKLWVDEPGSSAPAEHSLTRTGGGPERLMRAKPLRIFVSYSHRDRALVEELSSHLKLLQRQGLIDTWSDTEITAGQQWFDVIHRELNMADVILLMVSANFLASDFCWSVEMQNALKRHTEGSATVIPIILRPCLWQEAPFSNIQGLPTGGKPITSHNDTDKAWIEVASGIKKVAVARIGSR